MNIVFFIGKLKCGGAERQLLNLARGMKDNGHDVSIITLYPDGLYTSSRRGALFTVKLIPLWKYEANNIPKKFYQFALAPMLLRKIIKQIDPDIIYSLLYLPNLFAWLATRGLFSKRLVWGVRSSNMKLNWKLAVAERIDAFISRTVPLVIANSNAGLQYHKKHGHSPQQFKVIPNGIDTEKFKYSAHSRKKIRREIGLSQHQPLIGIIARLDPMKDHPTFLKAAFLVSRKVNNAKFICVGKGPKKYTDRLYRLTDELKIKDRVVWFGERSDMTEIYCALDMLVSSSSYGEGFSNVIGEAMACDIPCVVTDVGDSAIIVGDRTLVVKPGDPDILAQAIISTLKTKEEQINPEQFRERILNYYSFKRLCDLTEQSLNELIP